MTIREWAINRCFKNAEDCGDLEKRQEIAEAAVALMIENWGKDEDNPVWPMEGRWDESTDALRSQQLTQVGYHADRAARVWLKKKEPKLWRSYFYNWGL